MPYHVILCGRGGELDRRTVESIDDTADAARNLIDETAILHDGDVIKVVQEPEARP